MTDHPENTLITMQLGTALLLLLSLLFLSGGLFYLYTFNYDIGPTSRPLAARLVGLEHSLTGPRGAAAGIALGVSATMGGLATFLAVLVVLVELFA